MLVRKRTKKRTLVMRIIIVLSNYLRGKLSFSLYETILYWEIAMARNCLVSTRKKERTFARHNYNNFFCFFLSYHS